MLKGTFNYTPPAALTGSARDYKHPRGADLQARLDGFQKWRNLRRQHGLWPSAAAEEPPAGNTETDAGANFALDDPLNIAAHPSIKAAAREAVDELGAFTPTAAARAEIAGGQARRFPGRRRSDPIPTAWAAAYGVVKGLARPYDHILLDAQANPSLKEGAAAASKNIYLFRHNRPEECRRWLRKIRAQDTQNGVMVVTESLFSLESDTPDLSALQALCHEFNAVLLVDVSGDLGVLGHEGKGALGDQGMLGKVDLVSGDLSKAFGAAGGFVACRTGEVKEYLRSFSPTYAGVSAFSPIHSATALAALDIISGPEGQALRDALMRNIRSLRAQIIDAGFEVYGEPSGVVCVKIGSEGLARLIGRRLPEAGLIAHLAEFPAVPKGHARFRLQVTAGHTEDEIRRAVAALKAAHAAGAAEFEWLTAEREKLRAHG